MPRIYNSQDIRHFYKAGQITYCEEESMYYDPSYDTFYDMRGDESDVRNRYNQKWFERVKFYDMDGLRHWLPDQDPSRKDCKPDRARQKTPSSGEITNFIVIGTMSTCKITDFNEGNHAYTNWSEQSPCHFAIKSLVANHCMYWNSKLSGHCSCHVAYDHKLGNKISDGLERIDRLKDRDEKREIANLPVDHHFEDAERVGVSELNDWYKVDRLKILKSGDGSSRTIFYDGEWDVFFNGNGKFLKDMTTKRRSEKRDPQDFARTWEGKLSMEDIAQEWEAEVSNYSLVQDNSGVFTPLEMHEMMHEICRISRDRKSVEWNLDEDPFTKMSDEFDRGFDEK